MRRLRAVDAERADARWSQFDACAPHRAILAPIFDLSDHLFDLACRWPLVVADCMAGEWDKAFDTALAEAASGMDEADVMSALRRAKQIGALVCGLADLAGVWDTTTVTRRLTELADRTLQRAHAFSVQTMIDRKRMTAASGLSLIAMGKYGAFELNYSSDIDVIALFDPDDIAFPDRAEALDTAVKATRHTVKLMQERTADGYVFRTDLRLRPDPGSMPLAVSVAGAARYYEARGQNWERAAWIKARHAAGDEAVSRTVLADLVPFKWRRYLDFAAIADVHAIKRQIQSHRGLVDMHVRGHNVKLGRGGIREIEFFVQTQQLIAGGRDPRLRGSSTLSMLAVLNETGWIDATAVADLTGAYTFLRDVEHRIQMMFDRQEHSVPVDDADLDRLAAMSGFDTVDGFGSALLQRLRCVEEHYASLFEDQDSLSSPQGDLSFTGDTNDPATVETFERLGFERADQMVSTVRGWHAGRYRATASERAREALTALMPVLIEGLSRSGRPDDALIAFDRFLAGMPAGVQLFELLRNNHDLCALLLDLLGSAPRIADAIARRPHVLDALLEPRFFASVPTRDTLERTVAETLNLANDYETMLDRARMFAAEQRLLICVRLLGGSLTVERAGLAFTELAEVMLDEMLDRVRAEFAQRFGQVRDSRVCLIGMGRLGSRELTAGSDLDLIVLYDVPSDASASSGPKALDATQYHIRLVQALIAAISAPTAQGRMFELDLRLRPSGNSGPLATSVSAFLRHQRERAQTWELLALSRARFVAGDAELGAQVAEAMNGVLLADRDAVEAKADVREMRELMDRERPPRGPLDVKLAPGGLVDLEFMAQAAVLLGHAPSALDVADALDRLEASGLAKLEGARSLASAYAFQSELLQIVRAAIGAVADPSDMPAGITARLLKSSGQPGLPELLVELEAVQDAVRLSFERYLS